MRKRLLLVSTFICFCVFLVFQTVIFAPKEGRGCLKSLLCPESQSCHLIPLFYLLFRSFLRPIALSVLSFFLLLLMANSPGSPHPLRPLLSLSPPPSREKSLVCFVKGSLLFLVWFLLSSWEVIVCWWHVRHAAMCHCYIPHPTPLSTEVSKKRSIYIYNI